MKQTQLGTWKELAILVIALIVFKILGVLIGAIILAVALYLMYKKKKKKKLSTT